MPFDQDQMRVLQKQAKTLLENSEVVMHQYVSTLLHGKTLFNEPIYAQPLGFLINIYIVLSIKTTNIPSSLAPVAFAYFLCCN